MTWGFSTLPLIFTPTVNVIVPGLSMRYAAPAAAVSAESFLTPAEACGPVAALNTAIQIRHQIAMHALFFTAFSYLPVLFAWGAAEGAAAEGSWKFVIAGN
jgi:hypothetical protein